MSDTNEQMRIAIAEACGWKYAGEFMGQDKVESGILKGWKPGSLPEGFVYTLPDYLNDLNAAHEAEKSLEYRAGEFRENLAAIVERDLKTPGEHPTWPVHATAAQRAEAFCRTLKIGPFKEQSK